MQRARPNVGRTTVPMSGRNATRLLSTPQRQQQPYKPNEYGAPDAPGTGPKPVPPASSYTRPQTAGAQPVRAGTREVARVDSQGLVEAGQQTGTPAQPVQHDLPATPPSPPVYAGQQRS
jgi:hypothetical protein